MATSKEATLTVFRFDPEADREPRFDGFRVTARRGMTVLDALFDVLDQQDGSLAFRYSCRAAVCGSCAMYINGSYRLACETQIASLASSEITVSPLPHMPIIKDLVVDMSLFFAHYQRIKPYLVASSAPPEREHLQSVRQRKALDEMIDCILCAACYSSCPVAWMNQDYPGPAAFLKANRFLADSRDNGRRERLGVIGGEDGIWRCHTIFNCAEACPKKINPTWSIQQLKKRSVLSRLKFW